MRAQKKAPLSSSFHGKSGTKFRSCSMLISSKIPWFFINRGRETTISAYLLSNSGTQSRISGIQKWQEINWKFLPVWLIDPESTRMYSDCDAYFSIFHLFQFKSQMCWVRYFFTTFNFLFFWPNHLSVSVNFRLVQAEIKLSTYIWLLCPLNCLGTFTILKLLFWKYLNSMKLF